MDREEFERMVAHAPASWLRSGLTARGDCRTTRCPGMGKLRVSVYLPLKEAERPAEDSRRQGSRNGRKWGESRITDPRAQV